MSSVESERTFAVQVRLSQQEHEQLRIVAEREHRSMGAQVRLWVEQRLAEIEQLEEIA